MARALSAEDQNLTSSILTSRVRKYKDIDLTFAKKQTGDVYKKEDAAAVKQAIRSLLLTNRLERPFQPAFGANIRSYLFELIGTDTPNEIRRNIITSIEIFEPRAEILGLSVFPLENNNEIRVNLIVQVKNTTQQINFSFVVSRLR
jgi:hypothetical protein